MPTIAALPCHAAAVGFLLVLSHDYVLMRRDRSDIGLTFLDYFTALLRSKIGPALAWRDILLAGMKVKGEEAVRMGIMDSAVHDSEESVFEAAVRLGEQLVKRKWNGEVYAEIIAGGYVSIGINGDLISYFPFALPWATVGHQRPATPSPGRISMFCSDGFASMWMWFAPMVMCAVCSNGYDVALMGLVMVSHRDRSGVEDRDQWRGSHDAMLTD
ncbi:hypothetical protein SO802_022920 [Lithocarpus litseifolius]|uniref:Uncharacterized protein n=1 Tax=Lithocarpus litseifolius TaxID=425828 RepID=A0AAW2C6M5_9ROSI